MTPKPGKLITERVSTDESLRADGKETLSCPQMAPRTMKNLAAFGELVVMNGTALSGREDDGEH